MIPIQVLDGLTNYISNLNFQDLLMAAILISAGALILCALLRLVFGKNSIPVKSVSATLSILVIYTVLLLLPRDLIPEFFLTDLPFISITPNTAIITPLLSSEKTLLWVELVDLIILTFLCGLLEDVLPKTKNIISWIILRAISSAGAYAAYCTAKYILALLLPNFILNYAPIILLAVLALFLAVTVFKWLIGLILGVTGGPIIGAIYTFFISSLVGKQLSKSAFTGSFMLLLVYLAERFNCVQIIVDTPIHATLTPVLLIFCIVWYLISRVF